MVVKPRPRHPRKDLEEICRLMEEAGWRITRKKGYFNGYCPCGQHKHTVHLSPSNPYYGRNLTQWLRRQPCWPKDL